MAISMMVQPRDQMSAGAPYPRGPWSMISGAMYCRVPMGKQIKTVGTTLHKNLSGPLGNKRVNSKPLVNAMESAVTQRWCGCVLSLIRDTQHTFL